ncbi:Asp-tRNAAsn/Glu-tRNAGln amidotransferase A subunit [Burkholderia sp. 8Y]|uniref:amidase n=1 Tax=Burkholderia sp. 8Y TaxID=2653133 RepID=UPI0012EF859E|nr:amidase family protein [Burkholderia sp. 8Y]VXC95759.1 Asp-tRNAAsn/Glu-tRNAGln amidotransferase A subunit [Burkholderia sp. 8Y]
MTHDSLVTLSAVDARRLIGDRSVSPVELLDACIARIEAINPAVNAMAATCFDRAYDEARRAEAAVMHGESLGLLHGLPIGVKDLEETAGVLTTYGSTLFRANIPDEDNAMVARIRAAGAIVTAKTNTPDMGAGANTRNDVWGATGNPFAPLLNAGGSSGGSAAALATGMLPLCTGSDTGGSLRIPAALCGVVGLRPSPGLVPSERRELGWAPLTVSGPMARNVADVRLLLAAQAGFDARDPLTHDTGYTALAHRRPVDAAKLRIGYTDDFGACALDDASRATFHAKIDRIARHVGVCQPVSIDMSGIDRCFDVLRAQNFVAQFADTYQRDPSSLDPNTRANYEMGASMTLGDAVWAHTMQTTLYRRFQALMQHYDVILSPTVSVTPFPWSQWHLEAINGKPLDTYYRWLGLTYLVSLMTNPALSLPCGVDHAGMPFGVQLIGPVRRDGRLLDVSEALEAAFASDDALRRPAPDLEALSKPVPELRSIVSSPLLSSDR